MSHSRRSCALMLTVLAAPLTVLAQSNTAPAATSPSQSSATSPSAAPASSAQSEAGEPRAVTSPPESASAPGASAPGATEPAVGAGPAAHPAQPPRPADGASSRSPGRVPPGNAPGAKGTPADRLELGTATVTGDREQPKVMYIVPWKKSDIGDLSGKPMNSLLDEALAPVDRDEFKRQVMYYQVVKADAAQNGASKGPAPQGEK
jgi:hypothetical protein